MTFTWEKSWWKRYQSESLQGQSPSEEKSNFELEILTLLNGNIRSRSGSFWNKDDFSCCSKEIADSFTVDSFFT